MGSGVLSLRAQIAYGLYPPNLKRPAEWEAALQVTLDDNTLILLGCQFGWPYQNAASNLRWRFVCLVSRIDGCFISRRMSMDETNSLIEQRKAKLASPRASAQT